MLKELTLELLQGYFAGLQKSGLSGESIDKIRDVLSAILRVAVSYGRLRDNPAQHVRLKRRRKGRAHIDQVRAKYRELFGEEPRSKHREVLFRQVVWRMQALAEGGLSEPARKRALAIVNDADLRKLPARSGHALTHGYEHRRDPRIPPGTVLQRDHDGATITVKVLANGFEHDGKRYSSLSAIATQVTGTRWNGLVFFGLASRKRRTERTHAR